MDGSEAGLTSQVGGALVDYLVGDPVVVPPEHAPFFLERLALLPRRVSYQARPRPAFERVDSACCAQTSAGFWFVGIASQRDPFAPRAR
jgi:hypothetical protein